MKKTYMTWAEVEACVDHIVALSKEDGCSFSKVIGVASGGTIPAALVAAKLGLPLELISYSAKCGNGDNRDHDNIVPSYTEGGLLVVDDLTDSGHTLRELSELLPQDTKFATLVHKSTASDVYMPDYFKKFVRRENCADWIMFPWSV
jgi:hypoxanthine phosphoribosyltransferase